MESQARPANEIEVSLADIVRALVHGRKFMAFFTLAFAAVCLGAAFALAKYRSESLLYFYGPIRPVGDGINEGQSGLPLAVYDRILSAAKTPARFEEYLAAMQLPQTPEVDVLRSQFIAADGINGKIIPLYFTQLEQEERKKKKEKEVDGNVLGLRLEWSARDAQLSFDALSLLTRYLLDTVMYEIYHDRLEGNLHHVLKQQAEIENELFSLKIRRPQIMRQVGEIEALIEKYARLFDTTGQLGMRVTTEDSLGSSPVIKVMDLQVELAALDARKITLERKQQQTSLIQAFYRKAMEVHQEVKTAEAFVEKQPWILHTVFKGQDLENEVIREIFNNFTLRNQDIKNLYEASLRRVVQPTLPTVRSIKPGWALIAAGALLLGFLLAMMLVLCRAWWRKVSVQEA